jgi:hypothetical protein
VVSQVGVITVFRMELVSFLWLNVIGAVMVVVIALGFQLIAEKN